MLRTRSYSRLAVLVTLTLGVAVSGCFQAYNPSYFPNYGYGGGIDRTHAKPSGGAYFKNFDPQACKIELTPLRCESPVGKQLVLIAAVVDEDGQPRRSRRVEWILDGPGFIVEVDESGWYSARGYKVDNKYAVSHTDYKEHTITRGNDDPRDDFTIRPGETWCVVSSAVEGQTTVMAYAPEVFNWERGRINSVITWGPPLPGRGRIGDDIFPPPVISRTGNPNISTTVSRTKDGPPSLTLNLHAPNVAPLQREVPLGVVISNDGGETSKPVIVKATIPEGSEFVRGEPPPTTAQGRGLQWTLDALPSGATRTVQVFVKPTKKGMIEFVASAETSDGLRAEKRAGIPVDTASLKLALEAPPRATTGEAVPVSIAVQNTGAVPLSTVTAWVTVPDGVTVPSGASPYEVAIGPVPPGATKRVEIKLIAKQSGTYPVKVNVTGDGGLTDRGELTLDSRKAALTATISGPDQVALYEDGTWEVKATNAGEIAIPGATARLRLPEGLVAKTATDGGRVVSDDKIEWNLGTLEPGAKKSVRFSATGKQTLEKTSLAVSVRGTGANAVSATGETSVAVAGQPALTVEMPNPPGVVPVGRQGTARVTIRNKGAGPAKRVELTVIGSSELTLSEGAGPNQEAGQLVNSTQIRFPALDEIPPGGSVVYQVVVTASNAGRARLTAEVRADHLKQPVRDEQSAQVVP